MELEIRDLFEGAYLLSCGCSLERVSVVTRKGRRTAVFTIRGEKIDDASEAYRTGRAEMNVALLKFTLEKLKDAMFAELRKHRKNTGERNNAERKNPRSM